ncbi:helix-turn-helix domain-containing protein [Nocardia iowensis]|uniref:Helix-turn-helix domain-containing protein n=1 Tax=Nocardia iowensis TaxID=204891 RepID=A0ABX8RQH8_NOCIO|nr:helix-turn-helix domain-containing protein [Nocardia iowensis]QXN91874.1 helix-turn-helix domain-containing protein [Nocardia iowensis]
MSVLADNDSDTDDEGRAVVQVEPTFTVAEGAAILKQTAGWYLTRLRSGELPGHKAGRQWYLTESDVKQAQLLTARPAGAPTLLPAGFLPVRPRRKRPPRRA